MKLKFILPHDLSNSPDCKEVNRIDKGKIPTDGDRGEYEIGRLKHQIRIMAVVDLAQSCLLVGLVIHIWRIQSSLSSTLRLVAQLSDLVGQLLDDAAQLTDLVCQLLNTFM